MTTTKKCCEICKICECCSSLGAPFFLTSFDYKKIKERLKLKGEDFCEKKIFNGKEYRILLNKKNRECIFLKNGNCQIYQIRPLDCRIFPFDMIFSGGKFNWIKYDSCNGSIPNLRIEEELTKIEKRILPFLIKDIEIYINLHPKLFFKKKYRLLRVVDFSKTHHIAQKFNVTASTLHNWIVKNRLELEEGC